MKTLKNKVNKPLQKKGKKTDKTTKSKTKDNKKNKKSKMDARGDSRNDARKDINPDNEKFKINLDITDKSLIDFKKSKSISVATSISELKSSKIGEFYDVKPIHDNMHRLCQMKIQAKSNKYNIDISKPVSKQLCDCLFEKNKALTIIELEKKIKQKEDTPASSCITIYDNYVNSNKKNSQRKKSITKPQSISKSKSSHKNTIPSQRLHKTN